MSRRQLRKREISLGCPPNERRLPCSDKVRVRLGIGSMADSAHQKTAHGDVDDAFGDVLIMRAAYDLGHANLDDTSVYLSMGDRAGDEMLRSMLVVGARNCPSSACQNRSKQTYFPMADRTPATEETEAGGGGARQQDRPNCLEAYGERRNVPATGRTNTGNLGKLATTASTIKKLPC